MVNNNINQVLHIRSETARIILCTLQSQYHSLTSLKSKEKKLYSKYCCYNPALNHEGT
jgi:hypothetical protein